MREVKFDARVTLLPAEQVARVDRRCRRKRNAKIIAGVLIPVVVFTLFFTIMLNVRDLGVGTGSTDGKYARVLSDIEGITEADPRLIDIAMLGAHDANSFSVKYDSPIDNKPSGEILKKLYPVSSGFQYRMSVTQTVSPYQLLLQGVRMLHFKYTYYDNTWYATHSLLGRPFEEDVKDLLRFLSENPGEIVVIYFQCTYFGDQSYHTFHDWLATVEYEGMNIYDFMHYDKVNVFGSYFAEGVRIEELRYNDLTENGTSAGVVLMDRREADVIPAVTEESDWSTYYFDIDANSSQEWHNRMGSDVLIKEIDRYAEELAATDLYRWKLRVNQTQAALSTASVGDIFRDIGAWSLLKFAEKHNVAVLEHECFGSWLKAMPVFQVDFANSDYGDFNRRVNEKIRARNEEIVRILRIEGTTYEDLYG